MKRKEECVQPVPLSTEGLSFEVAETVAIVDGNMLVIVLMGR